MTVMAADVLRPSKALLVRYWSGADLDLVARVTCRDLGIAGTVLPMTQLDGRSVIPKVRLLDDAVACRRQWQQGSSPRSKQAAFHRSGDS
jgi:hypothetical protein